MGVAWNMAHQFRAQLPPAMLAATDSNASNKIVFRPKDPKDAAAAWLKAHPETIEPWLEGVTTSDGGDGLKAVQAALGS